MSILYIKMVNYSQEDNYILFNSVNLPSNGSIRPYPKKPPQKPKK